MANTRWSLWGLTLPVALVIIVLIISRARLSPASGDTSEKPVAARAGSIAHGEEDSQVLQGNNSGLGNMSSSGAQQSPPRHVPVYLYNEKDDEVFKKVEDACRPKHNFLYGHNHGAEFEFVKQLRSHPWRVSDPEEALLFVVPLYLGPLARKMCGGISKADIERVVSFLENSKHFQKHNGRDHLMVSTDYVWHAEGWTRHLLSPLWQRVSNGMTFGMLGPEAKVPFSCTVAVPFTGKPPWKEKRAASPSPATSVYPSLPVTAKEYLASRPYNLFFQGQTAHNKGYHERRLAFQALTGVLEPSIIISTPPRIKMAHQWKNAKIPICDEAKIQEMDTSIAAMAASAVVPASSEVPRLAGPCNSKVVRTFHDRLGRSKINLFFRGDKPSSARLFDAIDTSTVTWIFGDRFRYYFSPLECLVDWDNLVLWGDVEKLREGPEQFAEYVTTSFNNLAEEDWNRILRTMDRHHADLDWFHPESRVVSNILYTTVADCVPADVLADRGLTPADFQCPYNDENVFTVLDQPLE